MGKVFEDYFSELLTDMVSICKEYAADRADKIYIYCSYEAKVISCNFFYRINGRMYMKHKLNDALNPMTNDGFSYDTSGDVQGQVIDIILEDIEKINDVCKQFNREMPTEIKLIYDVKRNSMEGGLKYDLMYSNVPDKAAYDVANEWFDQIERENL
jgi:hypothetical protein